MYIHTTAIIQGYRVYLIRSQIHIISSALGYILVTLHSLHVVDK